MGFLKSKTVSTPTNQFSGYLKNAYSGTVDAGNSATNFIRSLLTGQGDTGASSEAFARYKDQAGYAPALRDISRGTVGQGAASGILNSGTTARRLQDRGAELNQGMFSNFLQQLSGLSGLGLNAGQLISGAGSTSTSEKPSTGSKILSAIGSIGSIFSDRRTKEDISRISSFPDGLGVYTFRYLGDEEVRVGVMADEVAELRPWALGPTVGGFQTVNYAAL